MPTATCSNFHFNYSKESILKSINKLLLIGIIFLNVHSNAKAGDLGSVSIPLKEKKSAPAIDLLDSSQKPIAPAVLQQKINAGFDSSILEPSPSNLYAGRIQPFSLDNNLPPTHFPTATTTLRFQNSLPDFGGILRAQVTSPEQPDVLYNVYFSLDTHAALARSALLRRLGYSIPSPVYYSKITLQFKDLAERDAFLDRISDATLTSRGRWVVGGLEEINKNKTTITFQDVALESALMTVPPLHWGHLVSQTINSRRSIRAVIVPLTLLTIPESINLYSFDPVTKFNHSLVFTRAGAETFQNETSIGDVRWIALKIASISQSEWKQIIDAGQYPESLSELIYIKTLARVDTLMKKLNIRDFESFRPNPVFTNKDVLKGKATVKEIPGFASRFSYGDPKSPLRPSELVRFFGIEGISGAISGLIDKANQYLQFLSPDTYVRRNQEKLLYNVIEHQKQYPNAPFIQPIESWGGAISGVTGNLSRSVMTGTYYGSKSEIQLVDAASASVKVGAFLGISGIKYAAVSNTTQLSYQRSYVHVRPITDIQGAWKQKWTEVLVPHFMSKLGSVLNESEDQPAAKAMEEFLNSLRPGEMFIIADTLSGSNATHVSIPIGAILGLGPLGERLNESISATEQAAVISRTTIYRDSEGLHVYLSKIRSGLFDLQMNTEFFLKMFSYGQAKSLGKAHTEAYLLPETYESVDDQKAFLRSIRSIFKRNNSSVLEEEFHPYQLDHQVKSKRRRIGFLPFSWTKRETFHELEIIPPVDKENRYQPEDHVRKIVQGFVTRTKGTDLYGFIGSAVKLFANFIPIGGGARGDDPSTNFLGRSHVLDVSTELEITQNRPNQLLTTLRESYNGWSMKRENLISLIHDVQKKLGQYGKESSIINEKEFLQTDKIQSYSVTWNLLIYENGLNRILKLLNQHTISTRDTQEALVNIMGKTEYQSWCKQNGLTAGYLIGPYALDQAQTNSGILIEFINSKATVVGCVTPWMRTVYNYRDKLKDQPDVFESDIHIRDQAKNKIMWVNRFLSALQPDLDLDLLVKWISEENAFFQARISGFRTKDENGDSGYFSDSIGQINSSTLTGPLSDIHESSKILMHELGARYLSDGY
jgi:hypothetical protein